MVEFIDESSEERMFPLFPKGWMVVALVVFTMMIFLAYSIPLATTARLDIYTALMPYMFVVVFLMMLTFSPRDSWRNFKRAYFYDVPAIKDKILAIVLSIAGGIGGYIMFLVVTSGGLVILAFPSGLSMAQMGLPFIISYFFIVSFYEESFTLWFSGTMSNNLYARFKHKETVWLISLIIGTVIWTFTHLFAVIARGGVGAIIPGFISIFSMGLMFRIVGVVSGGFQGRLYNPYFALFCHWVYDIFAGGYMAGIF